MRTWKRSPVATLCGNCKHAIAKGAPVLELTIGAIVKRRCANCDGPAPPDLPPLVELREEITPTFKRVALLPLGAPPPSDWKTRAAEREPGEDG